MKFKIKEFNGKPVTQGFFPKAGVKLAPGEEYETDDEDLYHQCLETDLVQPIIERKKPGRPRKTDEEV